MHPFVILSIHLTERCVENFQEKVIVSKRDEVFRDLTERADLLAKAIRASKNKPNLFSAEIFIVYM